MASYADHERILAAIDGILGLEPEIAALLADGARDRLIVVKPNWVQESHQHQKEVWEPVITNPAVLVCLLECLAKRILGNATICVCDAPHTYANFGEILGRGKFGERLSDFSTRHPNIRFELLDLRRETWVTKEDVVIERRPNPEDPRGYVIANLGAESLFYEHPGEGRYYGADYDSAVVNSHHHGTTQEYLVANTPIACDLFINVPKMKTHKKTGITCCLKNLVGINGDKNWLPHHSESSSAFRGDEFPVASFRNRVEFNTKRIGKSVALKTPVLGPWIYRKMRNLGKEILGDSETVVRNGNWSGNDTCWRMALDLNRALLYANSDGTWRDRDHPKTYLAIVDGITGGQGNGPLCPDPVQSNVLVSGTNPAEVDAVVSKLMGFNPCQIPIVRSAFDAHCWPIATKPMGSISVFDGRVGHELDLDGIAPAVTGGFVPHFGWSNLRAATGT